MKLTKERKILVAVLGLAMGGLAIDQLLPSSEASATEVPEVALLAIEASPAAAAVVESAPPVQGEAIGERLLAATRHLPNDLSKIRNAFVSPDAEATVVPTEAPSSAELRNLTAVIVSPGRSSAVVDGHLVAVGQQIEGYRLVSVSNNSATFDSARGRVVLTLVER